MNFENNEFMMDMEDDNFVDDLLNVRNLPKPILQTVSGDSENIISCIICSISSEKKMQSDLVLKKLQIGKNLKKQHSNGKNMNMHIVIYISKKTVSKK